MTLLASGISSASITRLHIGNYVVVAGLINARLHLFNQLEVASMLTAAFATFEDQPGEESLLELLLLQTAGSHGKVSLHVRYWSAKLIGV